jgi:hypothetical protein
MEKPPTVIDEPTRSPLAAPPAWRRAVDNPWLVLLTLFFVTAALGLPVLWISRGFSRFWKVVLTLAVLAWTALILWVFWMIMVWCVTTITDAMAGRI